MLVDLILILVIAVCAFVGYKKGLTGSLIKLLSFAIAVVIALVLYKPLANCVTEKTVIDDNIHDSIVKTLSKSESVNTSENKKGESTNFIQNLEKNIQDQAEKAKDEIVEQTATEATKTVVNAGSMIVLFIVARIILVVVNIFAKQVTKLPVIKQFDKTSTTIVLSPIPAPLINEDVTASVGHIPNIKTNVGFSFIIPLYNLSKHLPIIQHLL